MKCLAHFLDDESAVAELADYAFGPIRPTSFVSAITELVALRHAELPKRSGDSDVDG
jgi:hypothetical protein